jgi:hypothetical protein
MTTTDALPLDRSSRANQLPPESPSSRQPGNPSNLTLYDKAAEYIEEIKNSISIPELEYCVSQTFAVGMVGGLLLSGQPGVALLSGLMSGLNTVVQAVALAILRKYGDFNAPNSSPKNFREMTLAESMLAKGFIPIFLTGTMSFLMGFVPQRRAMHFIEFNLKILIIHVLFRRYLFKDSSLLDPEKITILPYLFSKV